jgi:hypothetical protein
LPLTCAKFLSENLQPPLFPFLTREVGLNFWEAGFM